MGDEIVDIKMLMNDFGFCCDVVTIEVMVNDSRLQILSLYLKKQHLIWLHVQTYYVDLLKYLNHVYSNSHDQNHLVQYYSCSRWKNFNIHSCNKQLLTGTYIFYTLIVFKQSKKYLP